MSLAATGASTKTVNLGTGVTNRVTRDPVVAAGALATLSEQTGGQSFFGIGVGDSALHNSGLKPATLKQLEEYMLAIKGLLTEGKARFQGRDLQLTWWNNMHRVPIYISAHGLVLPSRLFWNAPSPGSHAATGACPTSASPGTTPGSLCALPG